MEKNSATTEILNDLIRINNDRIVGYEKAIKNLGDGDGDLKSLFEEMIDESRQYVSELSAHVSVDKTPAEGTTVSGKIYRAWMDVKATFAGNDRKSVLEACEFGEDAAQKAYKEAIGDSADLGDIHQMIHDQKSSLRKSHDKIKALRDAAKALA